jgi:large subunit ribosomal protein L19
MKGISDTNFKISSANVEHRSKLDLRSGDTVRVWLKVEEKGKTRLQAFEGLVLARKHGSEPGATFTVRKIASGVGVERIFPLYSPNIDKIELVKRSKTRRSKLYYIRDKAAKEIRRKMRSLSINLPDFIEKKVEKEETEKIEKEDDGKNKSEDKEAKENEKTTPEDKTEVDVKTETPDNQEEDKKE